MGGCTVLQLERSRKDREVTETEFYRAYSLRLNERPMGIEHKIIFEFGLTQCPFCLCLMDSQPASQVKNSLTVSYVSGSYMLPSF